MEEGVFPEGTIHSFVDRLKSYEDRKLSEQLYQREDQIRELVEQYLHCM
jgi:hypothetical protein